MPHRRFSALTVNVGLRIANCEHLNEVTAFAQLPAESLGMTLRPSRSWRVIRNDKHHARRVRHTFFTQSAPCRCAASLHPQSCGRISRRPGVPPLDS